MMEDSGRPLTAKEKRKEQLRRWENSSTDVESAIIQNLKPKVKFNDGAVFLAACSSGDLDEVQSLLDKGADINFANVDGLTALHQACIDGNVDVVEFLTERGAQIDQQDNEGWTPLHAAASCGFMDIARYLVQKGAYIAAVNSEGELPLDIAEDDDMIDFLNEEIDNQGIDIESARNEEREMMTIDAKQQLNAVLSGDDPPMHRHPKSGATALHVAAAKGYINVLRLLLQAGMDVNVRDNDGWTPIHAASHWSQEEAAKLLADKDADFGLRSKLGQTACDVADEDMLEYLEELKENQEKNRTDTKDKNEIEIPASFTSHSTKQSSVQEYSREHSEKKIVENAVVSLGKKEIVQDPVQNVDENSCSSTGEEVESTTSSEDGSSKAFRKYEKEQQSSLNNELDHYQQTTVRLRQSGFANSINTQSSEPAHITSGSSVPSTTCFSGGRTTQTAPLQLSSTETEDKQLSVVGSNEFSSTTRPVAATQPIQASKSSDDPNAKSGLPTERNRNIKEGAADTYTTGLRKTGSTDKLRPFERSFLSGKNRQTTEGDERTSSRSSDGTTNTTSDNIRTARVAPILDGRVAGKSRLNDEADSATERFSSMIDRANKLEEKDASQHPKATFALGEEVSRLDRRRSHLQPMRDEEAEAQRKARSRKERQSRRSTQGVTLDVYEEAKRLIDHKKQERNESANAAANKKSESNELTVPEAAQIPHNDSATLLHQRLRHSAHTGASSRTVTLPAGYIPSSERVGRTAPLNVTTPTINVHENADDNATKQTADDKNTSLPTDQEAEKKLTRTRKPRQERSTGVVPGLKATDAAIDAASDDEEMKTDTTTDSDKSERLRATASRYDSSSLPDRHNKHSSGLKNSDPNLTSYSSNNTADKQDTKDYKKLYDEQIEENQRLCNELAEARRQIAELEAKLSRSEDSVAQRKTLEAEKRERRAAERRLAEVEKELSENSRELKTQSALNEDLKRENLSLTRLVTKLNKTSEPNNESIILEVNNNEPLLAKKKENRSLRASSSMMRKQSSLDSVDGDKDSITEEFYPHKRSSFSESEERRKFTEAERKSPFISSYKPSMYTMSSRPTRAYSHPTSSPSYSAEGYERRGSKDYLDRWPSSLTYSAGYSDNSSTAASRNKLNPSLSSTGYHAIPFSSSRSGSNSPRSSINKSKFSTSGRTSNKFLEPSDFKSSSSSYKGRAFEPSAISRNRPSMSFSSANSKRVGNLMDTYRSTGMRS